LCSRLLVRGHCCVTGRPLTVSTEIHSTVVASICASMVSRFRSTVQSVCRGQNALDTVTGRKELTAIFEYCNGTI